MLRRLSPRRGRRCQLEEQSPALLLVEDDPVSRSFLEHALEAQGHSVAVAEDGEQGWLRFLSDRFEVIIGDWNLPGMQGTTRGISMRTFHASSIGAGMTKSFSTLIPTQLFRR